MRINKKWKVNFNMMFKKNIGILLIIACLFLSGMQVVAAEEDSNSLPDAEILIIYSDDPNEETMDAVREIVKILTYQNFQVSFASATECEEELDRYSNIICYQLETYSNTFLQHLREFEEDANFKEEDASNQILFVGNTCLQEYYDETKRNDAYKMDDRKVGKLIYYFNDSDFGERLVEEEFFIFLKDTDGYRSGEITIGKTEGYFFATSGVISHIPTTDIEDELVKAAFSKEIAQWKWPYQGEPHIYAQYMLINKVYPFEDPEKLLQVINLMIDKEEPFVISVMPVYVNGDYPAMQRFCEVLRYAQANGGTVILHVPINQMVSLDTDLMYEYLTLALDIYVNQGVYPMALQVPSNWIFQEDTIEIMSHFRTIFIMEEEDEYIEASSDMTSNIVFKDGHQWIAEAIGLDNFKTSYLSVSSTAVSIDMQDEMQVIEEKIKACQTSFIPLKSLWDSEHSFWTEDNRMTYADHRIVYNDEVIENTFFPTEYEEEFSYNRNVLSRFSKDLTSENQKLVVAVSIISFLFLLFILIARYNNRKKFLLHPDDSDSNHEEA